VAQLQHLAQRRGEDRLRAVLQTDSPLIDPIDGMSGTAEWYGSVAVLPIR